MVNTFLAYDRWGYVLDGGCTFECLGSYVPGLTFIEYMNNSFVFKKYELVACIVMKMLTIVMYVNKDMFPNCVKFLLAHQSSW